LNLKLSFIKGLLDVWQYRGENSYDTIRYNSIEIILQILTEKLRYRITKYCFIFCLYLVMVFILLQEWNSKTLSFTFNLSILFSQILHPFAPLCKRFPHFRQHHLRQQHNNTQNWNSILYFKLFQNIISKLILTYNRYNLSFPLFLDLQLITQDGGDLPLHEGPWYIRA